MESISSISIIYGVISANSVAKAQGEAALALLKNTMEVQQALSQGGFSESLVDIYV